MEEQPLYKARTPSSRKTDYSKGAAGCGDAGFLTRVLGESERVLPWKCSTPS